MTRSPAGRTTPSILTAQQLLALLGARHPDRAHDRRVVRLQQIDGDEPLAARHRPSHGADRRDEDVHRQPATAATTGELAQGVAGDDAPRRVQVPELGDRPETDVLAGHSVPPEFDDRVLLAPGALAEQERDEEGEDSGGDAGGDDLLPPARDALLHATLERPELVLDVGFGDTAGRCGLRRSHQNRRSCRSRSTRLMTASEATIKMRAATNTMTYGRVDIRSPSNALVSVCSSRRMATITMMMPRPRHSTPATPYPMDLPAPLR